jgi:hypothetical protein
VDFLPASALAHPSTLRPPGDEDARCVQPTSATQSNCVHPHLVCSQILTPLTRRGRPTESKAPYGISGGPDVSRHPRTLRRARRLALSSSRCLAAVRDERGRFLPTARMRAVPLTPVSPLRVHPHASPAFAGAATWPYVLLLEGVVRVGGCGRGRGHRPRRLVKADVS